MNKKREIFWDVVKRIEMAYIATGLRPVRRNFGDGQTIGCAHTALAKAEGWNLDLMSMPFERMAVQRYSLTAYEAECISGGIMSGFDQEGPCRRLEYPLSDFCRLGFAIGRYVARRVFSEAPAEPACQAVESVTL